MIPNNERAANLLIGKTLQNGWHVLSRLENEHKVRYSSCYIVEKDNRKGFLKAFDYSAASKAGANAYEEILDILKAFKYEKEILEICKADKCRNIVEIIDSGELDVDEATQYPRVHYLILEYSEEGDIIDVLSQKNWDLKWKIKSLHQIAKGLNQLHRKKIAHQDLKPDNVVLFKGNSKITDLGSAIGLDIKHLDIPKLFDKNYAGTWELAPPELLYGDLSIDPQIRRLGCDMYLLGSMVVYYFTNLSMTSLIKFHLANHLCWTENDQYGKYQSVKADVIEAFFSALVEIRKAIKDVKLQAKVIDVITYLCHPDPKERGHKKYFSSKDRNYSLDRFITIFNWMENYISIKGKSNEYFI